MGPLGPGGALVPHLQIGVLALDALPPFSPTTANTRHLPSQTFSDDAELWTSSMYLLGMPSSRHAKAVAFALGTRTCGA